MRRTIFYSLLWLIATGTFIIHHISTQRKFRELQTNILERIETKIVTPLVENNIVEQEAKSEIKDLLKRIADYVRKLKFIEFADKHLNDLARILATKLKSTDPDIPWVFAITPTYARFTQKADLTRLAQTLMHVKNLHWIVVEDSSFKTGLVGRLLHESGLTFTHLYFKTPPRMQLKKGETRHKHHRGVEQRNTALKWLRDNVDDKKTRGAVYFMDDDNTYHIKIFDEVGMLWISCLKIKTN